MILTHFSSKDFKLDRARKYIADDRFFKPNGLWLSDERANLSWKKWCEEEKFGLDRLTNKKYFICDTKNWVKLRTKESILGFTKEFKSSDESKKYLIHCIDWQRVMNNFSGIVITPYQWSLRLHPESSWYYSWDCASGCVWDLSTVQEATATLDIKEGK